MGGEGAPRCCLLSILFFRSRLSVIFFLQDDWDDEDVSDDFANQLRAELDKAAQPAPMAQ